MKKNKKLIIFIILIVVLIILLALILIKIKNNSSKTSKIENEKQEKITTTKLDEETKEILEENEEVTTTTTRGCVSGKFDVSWFRSDFNSSTDCNSKGNEIITKYGTKYSFHCSYMMDDCGVTYYMLIIKDENGVSYDWNDL